MAEVTTKTVMGVSPLGNPGGWRNLIFVRGVSGANNDTLTVTGLTAVEGAFLISTTGTAATMTFATNVITITNGSTLTWTGLAWGT